MSPSFVFMYPPPQFGVQVLSESFIASPPACLVELDLSENAVDSDVARHLAAWLKTNPPLQRLILRGGGGDLAHVAGGELRDDGVALLAPSLALNTHLWLLNLSGQGLRETASLAAVLTSSGLR